MELLGDEGFEGDVGQSARVFTLFAFAFVLVLAARGSPSPLSTCGTSGRERGLLALICLAPHRGLTRVSYETYLTKRILPISITSAYWWGHQP